MTDETNNNFERVGEINGRPLYKCKLTDDLWFDDVKVSASKLVEPKTEDAKICNNCKFIYRDDFVICPFCNSEGSSHTLIKSETIEEFINGLKDSNRTEVEACEEFFKPIEEYQFVNGLKISTMSDEVEELKSAHLDTIAGFEDRIKYLEKSLYGVKTHAESISNALSDGEYSDLMDAVIALQGEIDRHHPYKKHD